MAEDVQGRFMWYDLMTTDTEAAIAFFTNVMGWGTEPFPNPEMPYTMWTANGAPIGGVMGLPPEAAGAPPHWLAYIGARDVDDTVRRAKDLGATVHVAPRDIPDVGRFAVLADPQGAAFAVYTPGSAPPAEQDFGVGQVSWHELLTTDSDAAQRFYFELFGWSITDTFDMGPMGIYAMYGRNGRTYGGMFNKPADMPAPPHWLLYVRVEDLDATIARAKKAGGQLLHGPEEVPGGDRIAHLMDPQGGAFALHEKKKG
jgi:predicted enzyme related to lactoylglutathione lyase